MLDIAKQAVKRLALRSGAISFLREVTRRDTLTVIMLHRVLPKSDPRFAYAAPGFTMRLDVFRACMEFCKTFCAPVSLDQIHTAANGGRPLPPNALLVTFDDGWEDTARYAVPILLELGVPAVVFVTSGAIGSNVLPWRDVAGCIWRARQATPDADTGAHMASERALGEFLQHLTPSARREWLEAGVAKAGSRVQPCVMSAADLVAIQRAGIAIGGHGVTHTSITDVDDADSEILPCMHDLTTVLGSTPVAFSFPNGRYTPKIAERVYESGFKLVFTSDAWLNKLTRGRTTGRQFGRICPSQGDITDANGAFSPEKLALLLLQSPVRPAISR